MQKLICTFLFTLLLLPNLFAQDFTIEKVSEVSPGDVSVTYEFPMLHGPDTQVTKQINKSIINDFLMIDTDTMKRSIFESVWVEEEFSRLPVYYGTDYSVNRLDNSLYSVRLGAEFCGAYCEYDNLYYTYNLKTGNTITLDSLIKPSRAKALFDELTERRRKEITDLIFSIHDSLASNLIPQEEIDYYREMANMYEECLEEKSAFDSFSDFKFYLTEKSLTLIAYRCSRHYNRDMDRLWDFEFTFTLEEFEPYLSQRGKQMLLE